MSSQHALRPRDGNAEMNGDPEERERLESYLKKAGEKRYRLGCLLVIVIPASLVGVLLSTTIYSVSDYYNYNN